MKLDNNTGLVLEGGGMRGVFTCGVLDAFMKHNMYFNYVVAVSAGAGNGMSYMSRQPGRARVTNIDYMDKFHFIGLRYLLTQGCIFDAELLYDKVPNEYVPFDYDAYSTIRLRSRWSQPTVSRVVRCISPNATTANAHSTLCVLRLRCLMSAR